MIMQTILFGLALFLQTSFYSLSITKAEGGTISLSQYEGKKIMLVNIATGSERVAQLAELQQLQQQYSDSLVIIAFPSNSFSNETRTNAEIKQFCQTNYGTTFLIAAKNSVSGTGLQPVYSWLFNSSENGDTSIPIVSDFQKIIIDKEGYIVGVFAPAISPTHSSIINTITGN